MNIKKTISLRILRPYCTSEIETEIKAEKEKRKETGETGSLNSLYFQELKKKYPLIIINSEFFPLLSEMQRNITSIYNRTISQLYQRLIVDKESISTAKALSEGPYRDFKSTFNSYIALGLRQKIQSNFRKKDLMAFKIALPTAKSDKFPIPIYMVIVHPHLNLPHQGRGIQGDNEYSPPLVGGVRGGGELLQEMYRAAMGKRGSGIL